MSINRKATACLFALMLGSGVGVAGNRFVYRAVKDTINAAHRHYKTECSER